MNETESVNSPDIIHHIHIQSRKRAHSKRRDVKAIYTILQQLEVRRGNRSIFYWIIAGGVPLPEGKPQRDPDKPMTKNQMIHLFRNNWTKSAILEKGELVESSSEVPYIPTK
jgi:hypothetical protein